VAEDVPVEEVQVGAADRVRYRREHHLFGASKVRAIQLGHLMSLIFNQIAAGLGCPIGSTPRLPITFLWRPLWIVSNGWWAYARAFSTCS
jgi:hypothetical protein